MPINARVERPKRGANHLACDGAVCMNCGVDVTGQLSLVEGLSRCFDEFGWNRVAGLRLYDLVDFHKEILRKEPLVPVWFADAWGVPGREVARALYETDQELLAVVAIGEIARELAA